MGRDTRLGLPRPTRADLLTAGAEFALDFLAGARRPEGGGQVNLASMRPAVADSTDDIRRPEILIAAGVRRLTKLVLFPVRFMFTAATGRVGTNHAAVEWYLSRDSAPSRALVSEALAWRSSEPTDSRHVAELLQRDMMPLYLYYIDDHVKRLEAAGNSELANGFREWRACLYS